MNQAKVLRGEDIIRNREYIEFSKPIVEQLDPFGVNVIVEQDETASTIRADVLFKLVNQEEPVYVQIIVPYVIFKGIVNTIIIGDKNVH